MYVKFFKPSLDFLLSFIGVIVLTPVYVLLSVLGFAFMRGKPFFTQDRVSGFDRKGRAKIFKIIKFRTMKERFDKEGREIPFNKRLTPYGKFLRATSLDETLQLINVLLFQMSLVGPRPVPIDELEDCDRAQLKRLLVKGGITGLAQINGRNKLDRAQKYDYDCEYVKKVAFTTDLKIFFTTFSVVLRREGIYQKAHLSGKCNRLADEVINQVVEN